MLMALFDFFSLFKCLNKEQIPSFWWTMLLFRLKTVHWDIDNKNKANHFEEIWVLKSFFSVACPIKSPKLSIESLKKEIQTVLVEYKFTGKSGEVVTKRTFGYLSLSKLIAVMKIG